MATPEDDRRHVPGSGSLPLWSESYWFPLYDPDREIGIVFRAGMHVSKGQANLYLFITHRGAVVHTLVDHRLCRRSSTCASAARGTGASCSRCKRSTWTCALPMGHASARHRDHAHRRARTWLKDGFTRNRYGNRVGYGILEHGYVESA